MSNGVLDVHVSPLHSCLERGHVTVVVMVTVVKQERELLGTAQLLLQLLATERHNLLLSVHPGNGVKAGELAADLGAGVGELGAGLGLGEGVLQQLTARLGRRQRRRALRHLQQGLRMKANIGGRKLMHFWSQI